MSSIDNIIKEEMKDLISFVNKAKQDRILGQAVTFDWIYRKTLDGITYLEMSLEGYNPVRMKVELKSDETEEIVKKFCTSYKNLLFRHMIFTRN